MKDFAEMMAAGESETVEFKPSLSQIDKIMESVSAFSNSAGGTIAIGVGDSGKILGIVIGKNTLEELANQIKRNTDPSIFPSLETLEAIGKKIILIKVAESPEKPVFFREKAYKRVGRTNQRISASEIRKMAKEEKKKLNWDEQVCEGANLKDIDEEKLRWFLQTARTKRNYLIDKDTPIKDALTHLNLLHNEGLKNAAILIFSKNPQRFHIQAEVKCIYFHGIAVEKPFESYHIYKGNVFDQVDRAIDFVLGGLKTPVIPEAGKATTQTPHEIPSFAVREAIVNGVVHRDYASTAGVQVMVFSDRIEIWNPGGLPPQLKLDSLKKSHPSIPHNPLLAEAFQLTTYIEKAGSGTVEMVKQCRERGLPEPVFEEKMGCFVVTIWRDIYTPSYLERFDLNERQMKGVMYAKEKGRITNKEYRKLTGLSDEGARIDLNGLVGKNVLRIRGGGRSVHYVLKLGD